MVRAAAVKILRLDTIRRREQELVVVHPALLAVSVGRRAWAIRGHGQFAYL